MRIDAALGRLAAASTPEERGACEEEIARESASLILQVPVGNIERAGAQRYRDRSDPAQAVEVSERLRALVCELARDERAWVYQCKWFAGFAKIVRRKNITGRSPPKSTLKGSALKAYNGLRGRTSFRLYRREIRSLVGVSA